MTTLNIVLVFHSSRNDNLGVGALTEAEVEIIRKIAKTNDLDIKITIVDGAGARDPYVVGPDIEVKIVRVLRKPWNFFFVARKCDLVIDIGAGDSFTDIYGAHRITYLLVQKYLTHLALKPLVVAPQTIGPFKTRLARILAGFSIKRSALVCSRDALSTQCARDLGFKGELIEASDVAFRLPYEATPKSSKKDKPIKVGLNVSGLLMGGGYSGKNMFGLKSDYPALIDDICRYFLEEQPNCELHLVSHVITASEHVEDDLSASKKLAKKFPNAIVAPSFVSPSAAKTYISDMDFFMGARMHSCIAAVSSGVPVVPMAYSRKFAGLFGTLGYNHVVDCTSESNEVIYQKIVSSFEARDELETNAAEAYSAGLAKLQKYEDALTKVILKAAKK